MGLRRSDDGRSVSRGKKLIIMDEVDGMNAGDRGGAQELGRIIKVTQTPIICICNDRENPKIRTLASACYDLVFSRPPTYGLAVPVT